MAAFGKHIKAWRNAKDMTQEQLAKASGMHRVAIANLETGTRGSSPAWDTVAKLAAALGITAEALTTTMPDAKAEEPAAKPKRAKPAAPSTKPAAKPKRKKGGA